MSFSVQSEVGQLRQAIVHRPGLELARLTPQNIGELLFDDVMWARKAKEEHDVFAEALRDQGVQVHYFGQLLAETLECPRAGRSCSTGCAPRRSWARGSVDAAAAALRRPGRAGPGRVPGRRGAQGRPAPGAGQEPEVGDAAGRRLPAAPLPNHLFPRDNSCWVYGGVSVNPMAKPARQRETVHVRAVYRYHPMFAGADFATYYGDDDASHLPATIEGGDVHVIGNGAVLIGMGERTTPMAVEILAHALFAERPGRYRDRGGAAQVARDDAPGHRR